VMVRTYQKEVVVSITFQNQSQEYFAEALKF
jgi:hypothetical protein